MNGIVHTIVSVIDSSVTYYALNRRKSNILVFGFIKSLFDDIPNDIIYVIIYYYFEAMPSFFISGCSQINYEKSQIFREYDDDEVKDKTYCISQIGWISGNHSFKIKANKLPNGSISIGLATDCKGFVEFKSSKMSLTEYAHDWAFDSKQSGISYQLYFDNDDGQRNWYFDGIYAHNQGQQTLNEKQYIEWKENDKIGLQIDCNQWTLRFYINDKAIGRLISLQQDCKYYPAIAFGGNNNVKLKLVEFW